MKYDALGIRMKGYEHVEKRELTRRMPTIIRIDGCHFHSYTKKMEKPFDRDLFDAMIKTSIELCKNISGAKLAYTQSDEISILLTDYDNLDTQPWFGKSVQKLASVSASIATAAFNRDMLVRHYLKNTIKENPDQFVYATFDARVFNLPKEEVNNYFVWRQKDAIKNSVSMVAQSRFSHKSLQNLSTKDMKEKLLNEVGYDWENDLEDFFQKGSIISKTQYEIEHPTNPNEIVTRSKWTRDMTTTEFVKCPDYINDLINLK